MTDISKNMCLTFTSGQRSPFPVTRGVTGDVCCCAVVWELSARVTGVGQRVAVRGAGDGHGGALYLRRREAEC